MGLDSVALVVDVEKHFNISISNSEAEKIYTVQDFADCVYSKVIVNPSQKCKSQILFYRFRMFFINRLDMDREKITANKKLKDLIRLDELQKNWDELEKDLSIELPTLSQLDLDPTKEKEIKMLGLKFWTRKAPVTDGTIGDLINWALALNHKKFIDPKNLCNNRDVEKIIIGIISESIGVPVDEIKLEHSITNDLGVD